MEYVTIKNGVVSPITERKQLYTPGFIIKNRIIALDWTGDLNTDETEINDSIITDNVPTNCEKVHVIFTISKSSNTVSRVNFSLLKEYHSYYNYFRGFSVDLLDNDDGSRTSSPRYNIYVSKGPDYNRNEVISISLTDKINAYADYTADIEITNNIFKVNGKIICQNEKCELAKSGFCEYNGDIVSLGNLLRCKKVFIEYLNYE